MAEHGLTIKTLKAKTRLTDVELDKAFQEDHLIWLAPHFGSPLLYIEADGFNLKPAEKEDVKSKAYLNGNRLGMHTALKWWLKENPFATPRKLLEITLKVGELKKDLLFNVCKIIKSMKISCNNRGNGCKWTGKLGGLDTHLQSCGYTLLPCCKGCTLSEGQEVRKLLAKDMENHLKNDCPNRDYQCELCKEKGEYEYLTTDHLQACPRKRVPCPNNPPCSVYILRCNIDTHRSTCKYEPVPCKYSEVGCEERPLRKDLKEHEEDDQLHLRITTERVLGLNKKVTKNEKDQHYLQETVSSLNKKVAELDEKQVKASIQTHTFKLANFQKQKTDNYEFYSPPFYTSHTGYKMCVSVYANGNGDGEGTHVSVFAHLMKGDNDDSLTWPFTGTVTIELLNQLEDKNHHKKSTTFPADSEYSKRVVDGERAEDGWGCDFISHAELDYQPDKNCQYLKDDTLIFRVSVQVPDHKPWLECTM